MPAWQQQWRIPADDRGPVTTPDALRRLAALGRTTSDRALLRLALGELDARHQLAAGIAAEPNLEAIMAEFVTRLSDAFGLLPAIRGTAVLDFACGSSSSRSPVTGRRTTEFEPWMCRLLVALGAHPVGLDIGEITDEAFEHHRVDLTERVRREIHRQERRLLRPGGVLIHSDGRRSPARNTGPGQPGEPGPSGAAAGS